jgi:cytochrome P450
MRAKYGDPFTTRAINGTVVSACSSALAKQIYTADPATFRTFGTDTLAPILGAGSVLLTWGEPHKRSRKLLQPPFHGARMRAYGKAMQDVAREAFASFSRGARIKAHDITTRISLDVILRTVFGLEGAALEEGRRMLGAVLDQVSPLVVFSPQFQSPLFPPWRRLQRAQEGYRALVERVVTERRRSGVHGEDILGMLLDARWDDGREMTLQEIEEQLLTLLVAGHETTAISLAWAVHDVYRRGDVLARLRAEIDGLGPDAAPDELAKLPYLGAVCDESLRLRPIVTDTPRILLEPFELGGYLLPKGVGVSVMIEAIHADPSIYPEPEKFRPERFLAKKPGPFEFLPFGGGNRRCLGAAFSDYEARVVLGTLVSSLDLKVLGDDTRVRRNITMGPKRGVPVEVVGKR